MGFNNYAGQSDADDEILQELELAGITTYKLPEASRDNHPEMRTIVFGGLHGWAFNRAWRYWVCTGPGIPPDDAEQLHAEHGRSVRVDGHCGCPSPLEWFKGFAVGHYHVDSQEGLNALAETIRGIVNRNTVSVVSGGDGTGNGEGE